MREQRFRRLRARGRRPRVRGSRARRLGTTYRGGARLSRLAGLLRSAGDRPGRDPTPCLRRRREGVARDGPPILRGRSRTRDPGSRPGCRSQPVAVGRADRSPGGSRRTGRVSGRPRSVDRHLAPAARRRGRPFAGRDGDIGPAMATAPRSPDSCRQGRGQPGSGRRWPSG